MKTLNPLKLDPTRSITLRQEFSKHLTKVFSSIRQSIYNLLTIEDALGLKRDEFPIANKRWKHKTQSDTVDEFEKWLKQQVQEKILSESEVRRWKQYINRGFEKGTARAFDDTSKFTKQHAINLTRSRGFVEGRREEFIRSSINHTTAVEKIKLLSDRAMSEVKGMTDDLILKGRRILTDGLTRGLNPTAIARNLSKQLRISQGRGESIAHTELVRAHADGQLEAMEQLGITEVGVAVEWSTTSGACKLCQPLEGIVLKISEAKGMIPRHPRCKCAFQPANIGEDKDERKHQKRGKYKIDKAIKQSQRREGTETTDWKPAKPIARQRPKSPVFNEECDCNRMHSFAKLLEGLSS